MSLTLTLGKGDNGTHWICLSDPDSTDSWPIAQFIDETRMHAFTLWMESEGYIQLSIPSEEELGEMFE